MLLYIGAVHIKFFGLRENVRITISSAVPHDNFLILGNALLTNFGVLCCRSAHGDYRGDQTKRLVGHFGYQLGLINNHLTLLGKLRHKPHSAR